MLLSQQLRAGTRHSHRVVERCGFIAGFLRGVVSAEAYAGLLSRLLPVYQAMEAAVRRQPEGSPLARICPAELWRSDPLAADLALYQPGGLRGSPSAATARYLARLAELEARAPLLLASHLYCRYLGDLSGGQVLKRIVLRTLAPPAPAGVRFYEFGSADRVAELKADFRASLDALAPGVELAQTLVDEANLAFTLNGALFAELQGNPLASLVRLCRPQARRLAA